MLLPSLVLPLPYLSLFVLFFKRKHDLCSDCNAIKKNDLNDNYFSEPFI